jgi:predicted DNA-binding protein (UPF0251 family)
MSSTERIKTVEEELITLDEAARRYGISRDGIYYHVRAGNLTTYKKLGDKKAYVKTAEMEALKVRPSSGTRRHQESESGEMPSNMLRASVEKARKELIEGVYISEEDSQARINNLIAEYTKQAS